ncbi:selenocysteine-specific translation elongation factor [Candidatus Thorarchaeota archaeon]|nr:MAG: selenocysteine-specific translation elongation factor [Candidatus Thorarchaeota archaeon]
MEDLIPVHVGLMGHIDHGKTELARVLTEKASTAGLDKHPQSRERGITIDLGFTMFQLERYLVTLVDAPGHADLIRSVVAGANIIDAAILTVAADEGPKIQTGEHLIVLKTMGIDSVLVAITKTDLVDEAAAQRVEKRVREMLAGTIFRDVEYVQCSAKTGTGIDKLKQALSRILQPGERNVSGPLLMPIDHAFPVRGHGTVVTGTIVRGELEVGKVVEICPKGERAKVRTIQTFGENRERAAAGDRIGVNIPDVPHESIERGDYLTSPDSVERTSLVTARITINPLYLGRVTERMILSVTVGMPSITGDIIPFECIDGKRIILSEVREPHVMALLRLKKKVVAERGMKVLLMRTDLPAHQMRIIGSGEIEDISEDETLFRKRVRKGRIERVREKDSLLVGLAATKKGAERLKGMEVTTDSGVIGTIGEPFGTRGLVSAVFKDAVESGEEIHLNILQEETVES